MKYLKGYKLFESYNQDILDDLNDMFLEVTDCGSRIEFRSNRTINTISMKFVSNGKFNINDFFNTDEFKRAYWYINDKGFTCYYIDIHLTSGQWDGSEVVNSPSSKFDDPTPWVQFKNDPTTSDNVIEMEFHRPLDSWHVIWIGRVEEDWDHYSPNADGYTLEEAKIILGEATRLHPQDKGRYKGKFRIISDKEYWEKQR